jgi:hypothetical protein
MSAVPAMVELRQLLSNSGSPERPVSVAIAKGGAVIGAFFRPVETYLLVNGAHFRKILTHITRRPKGSV